MSAPALERTDSQKDQWKVCADMALSKIMNTYPVDHIAYRIQESTTPLLTHSPGLSKIWIRFFQKKFADYSKKASPQSVLDQLHLVMTNYLYCMETGRKLGKSRGQDPYDLKKHCK